MEVSTIDGKATADTLRAEISVEVAEWAAQAGRRPGLAVVLVGSDPASEVYVGSKARQTVAVGMRSFEHRLPAETSQADLLSLIAQLNGDDTVDGILLQLPLPAHIRSDLVINAIDPAKDVDGFHPENVGRLMSGLTGLVPCTPLGCMLLLRSVEPAPGGLHAVVVGRSNIVGKSVAQLLLQADCTVTTAHSRSRDLPGLCRMADILIAAAGRPEMVRGDWIKPGAIVIDVGINRLPALGAAKGGWLGTSRSLKP